MAGDSRYPRVADSAGGYCGMDSAVIDMDRVVWHKSSNPIGHPRWEGDTEFEGPRTPPTISLAIEYSHDGELLRHAVTAEGTWDYADILYPSFVAETGLHEQLLDWLKHHSERNSYKTT